MFDHLVKIRTSISSADMKISFRPKCLVIISDLRPIPLLIAASLYLKSGGPFNASLLVSEELSHVSDYGDELTKPWRAFLFSILSFVVVKRVKTSSFLSIVELDKMHHSAISSTLGSLTSDSAATIAKYPDLHHRLCRLANGARSLAAYIAEINPDCIYLFNGRLISSKIIEDLCIDLLKDCNQLKFMYYEFNTSLEFYRFNFSLWDHSIFDLGFHAEKMLRLYQSNIIPLSVRNKIGNKYTHLKLSNYFARQYDDKLQIPSSCDCLILLSSSHEYCHLDPKFKNSTQISLEVILKTARIMYPFPKSIIVREHPNQVNDKSVCCVEAAHKKTCLKYGSSYISSRSRVSSHKLILSVEGSVLVDISSVGIDAYLLGKKVVILGNPTYKGLLKYVDELPIPDSMRSTEFAFGVALYDRLNSGHKHHVFVLPLLFFKWFLSSLSKKLRFS